MTYSNGDVLTDDQMAEITATGAQFLGCVLFSNRGDNNNPTGITASNISISAEWQTGPQIVSSFVQPTALNTIASTDSSNIDHMLYLFEKDFDFIPSNVVEDAPTGTMFTGSFQEMWVNLGAVLGNDMMITSTQLDNYYASSVSLDSSRDGVSSVDLNDEATNLIQYTKSYQAACRLMTTIDTVLDKLINNTGVTT
jgi:flagellar hook-associated protein 1 FlgK